MNKIDLKTEDMRHPGWFLSEDDSYRSLFSEEHLAKLQQTIRNHLSLEISKDIVVSFDTIRHVLHQVYETHTPVIGDPFTRFRQHGHVRNDVRDISDRTITIIISEIKNEYITIKQNSQLSIWNTQYGTHNAAGLKQTPQIKINHRKPKSMQFHMRY